MLEMVVASAMLNETMKLNLANSRRGITLIEVVVVVGVLVVLAAMLLPTGVGVSKSQVKRHECANNLKQMSLALNTWAMDNGDKFPILISMTNHGTMEFAQRGDLRVVFLGLSNELATPKLLICPSDTARKPARTFDGGFNIENISYFVGIDASDATPAALLFGDGNITNSAPPQNHILSMTTNDVFGWTDKLHNHQGNVGLADGSVQQYSDGGLRKALAKTGLATNRLAIP